jgi:hypothetical protein
VLAFKSSCFKLEQQKKNQDFTNVLMHRIAKLTVGFVAE